MRPLFDSEYIFGIHEPGGEQHMLLAGRPGWITFSEAVGADPNDYTGVDFRSFSAQGLGVICRINHGYEPHGTIPHSSQYEAFALRVANFVQTSVGCKIWVIGNEMNHAVERPGIQIDWSRHPSAYSDRPEEADPFRHGLSVRFNALPHTSDEIRTTRGAIVSRGEMITPELYAQCYRLCSDAIHRLPGHEDDLVLVGAVCPWNTQSVYQGNPNGDWVQYFREILEILGPRYCEGFALHAYTHGSDPRLISSDAVLGPPFQNYHHQFRVFMDFMNAVPEDMRELPVVITEADQSQPWTDENTGWVQRAFAEINAWNSQPSSQQIRALCLYHWPRFDKFFIDGKQGVAEDFILALQNDYRWQDPYAAAVEEPLPGMSELREPSAGYPSGQPLSGQVSPGQVSPSQVSPDQPYPGPPHAASGAGSSTAPPGPEAAQRQAPSLPGSSTLAADPASASALNPALDSSSGSSSSNSSPGSFVGQDAAGVDGTSDEGEHGSASGGRVEEVAPAGESGRGRAPANQPYQIEWLDSAFPDRMLAGEVVEATFTIRNRGTLTWSWGGTHPFQLGYHYYRNRRKLPQRREQDIRTDVPHDITPGMAAVIQARIALPDQPGNYTLEVDLVHEGVSWFKEQDATVLTRWLTVEAPELTITSTGDSLDNVGLPVPLFADVSSMLPRPGTYALRNPDQIDYLVISSTAGDPSLPLEWIAQIHAQYGYPGIAYNFVVDATGQVFKVTGLDEVAQPNEEWSSRGVNICLAGDFSENAPSLLQLDATSRLCAWLCGNLTISPDVLMGLGELTESESPGQTFYIGPNWKELLRRQVQLNIAFLGGSSDNQRFAELEELVETLKAKNSALTGQLEQSQAEREKQRLTTESLQAEVTQMRYDMETQTEIPTSGLRITNIIEQLPRDASRYTERQAASVEHFVINQTGTDSDTDLKEIAAAHAEEWPGILFDFVIEDDGAIFQAQPLDKVVDTGFPYLAKAVNIAFAGSFNDRVPSDDQLYAGGQLITWLLARFPQVGIESVKGLNEFVQHESPGNQWLNDQNWKEMLMASVRRASGIFDSSETENELRNQVDELERQLRAINRDSQRAHDMRLKADAEVQRLQSELAEIIPASPNYIIPEPGIRDISEELPRHPSLRYTNRSLSQITHLAIHHTATPPTMTAHRIAELHVNADPARGKEPWPAIGYHYFIHADGSIEQTNPLEAVSYHVYRHNEYTVGIGFVGSFMNGRVPTSAQIRSGAHLVAWMMQELKIPMARVWGHREFPDNTTVCPGTEWTQGMMWRDNLFRHIEEVQSGIGIKQMRHYMLFWQRGHPGPVARQDFVNAINYIARFRPSVGFSIDDARNAEYVTIVGNQSGITAGDEQMLRNAGCQVERVVGRDEEETGRILADLARLGRRFQNFEVDF